MAKCGQCKQCEYFYKALFVETPVNGVDIGYLDIYLTLYIFHLAFQGSEENRVCTPLTEQQMKALIPLSCVILTKLCSVSTLSSGLQGSDAHVPRLSFSAALTRRMRKTGTIEFNEVFANENKAYDPETGVC